MRRAAVAVALLLLAGCGAGSAEQPPLLMANGVAREAPATDAPVSETVDGLTRFGYDLYRQVAQDDGGNVVLSPICVGYAFAMARAGAKGETAAQLDRVLGLPGGRAPDALNAISADIVTVTGPPGKRPKPAPGVTHPPVVSIANGLFVQRDFPVGEPFLRTLAAKYGAGVRAVDFGSGEAGGAINEWARVQTADRIKKVFDSLDPATRVVLANAVYFRADWTHPFLPSPQKEPFTRADGSTVEATLMSQSNELRYAAGPGWQAVELPYAQSEFAMWIMLPTAGSAPDGLLAPKALDAVAGGLKPARVEVIMPRWDFETRPELVPALQRLGLTAPFGPAADFSGIAPGLFIGQAMHAANITVDETGTEAAAVAAVGMPVSAPAAPDFVVRADRPFAFAIMHLPTGTPLFIGRLGDPTGS